MNMHIIKFDFHGAQPHVANLDQKFKFSDKEWK
jgi:hypothetical protein